MKETTTPSSWSVTSFGRKEKPHKLTWEKWLHDAIRVPFYSSISPWLVVTSCVAKWIGLNSAERKCSTRSHDFTYLKASTGFRSLPPFFFTCSTTTMVNITRKRWKERAVMWSLFDFAPFWVICCARRFLVCTVLQWFYLFIQKWNANYFFKRKWDDLLELSLNCCSFISISNQMGDPCTTASLDVPYADPANYDGLTFYGVSDFQNLIQINRPNSLFNPLILILL